MKTVSKSYLIASGKLVSLPNYSGDGALIQIQIKEEWQDRWPGTDGLIHLRAVIEDMLPKDVKLVEISPKYFIVLL